MACNTLLACCCLWNLGACIVAVALPCTSTTEALSFLKGWRNLQQTLRREAYIVCCALLLCLCIAICACCGSYQPSMWVAVSKLALSSLLSTCLCPPALRPLVRTIIDQYLRGHHISTFCGPVECSAAIYNDRAGILSWSFARHPNTQCKHPSWPTGNKITIQT